MNFYLFIKSVSTRKPCKIWKFVHKQGCPIFMIFGGLEGLCTSILNPLHFLSEIQYGCRTERNLDLRLLDQKFPVKYQKIHHLDVSDVSDTYLKIIINLKNPCLIWYKLSIPINRFYHTMASLMDLVTPTDCAHSVHNRCEMEVFGGVFVLSLKKMLCWYRGFSFVFAPGEVKT